MTASASKKNKIHILWPEEGDFPENLHCVVCHNKEALFLIFYVSGSTNKKSLIYWSVLCRIQRPTYYSTSRAALSVDEVLSNTQGAIWKPKHIKV